MANISNAFGHLTIIAKDRKTIDNLINLIDSYAANSDYFTDIEDGGIYRRDSGMYRFEGSFIAGGRWSYTNNLEIFRELALDSMEKLARVCEKEWWRIDYDFTDYEPGMDLFYNAQGHIEHGEGMRFEDIRYTEDNHEDIDITLKNILDYDMEELDIWLDHMSYEYDGTLDDFIVDHRGELYDALGMDYAAIVEKVADRSQWDEEQLSLHEQ
ncbi:MAG: hypothetical protein HUJ53_10695 [Holdemanella sp.]|nr:hypothetical protein [Holdemanella sp.]